MNNRNLDAKPYFISVTRDLTVHIAWTKYNPDQYVQADITRDQVFEQFSQLKDVDVFTEVKDAIQDSKDKYYQVKFSTSNTSDKMLGLFKEESLSKSSDQNLIDTYGESCVVMGKRPITLLYQVQIPDDLKQTFKIEDKKAKLGENEKKKLKLELAVVQGLAVHFTDEYATKLKVPPSEYLVDHKKLSAKASNCVIL